MRPGVVLAVLAFLILAVLGALAWLIRVDDCSEPSVPVGGDVLAGQHERRVRRAERVEHVGVAELGLGDAGSNS